MTTTKPEPLGDRIKRLREAIIQPDGNPMTQEDLARLANISVNTVSKIEVGETKNPSSVTLLAIAFALGVGIEKILLPGKAKEESVAP